MSGERRFYNAKFYRQLEATQQSAEQILPMVFELFRPTSIVDIGCGAGHWLATAKLLGVSDVLGIDGGWVLEHELQIPRDKFQVCDLKEPLQIERKFDLALALEVAEHLPPLQAAAFVTTLCEAADVVLFSAAIPGQGGRHHVNEQWPAYWARLFAERGFSCYDVVREKVWNNPKVLWYYAQNCLLFARPGLLKDAQASPEPLALVHSELWAAQVTRMNSPGKLLERLPKAVVGKLRRREGDG